MKIWGVKTQLSNFITVELDREICWHWVNEATAKHVAKSYGLFGFWRIKRK